MEKEIEFYVDGILNGSATLFINNGEMDTSMAEEKFYKVLRSDRQALIEEEREYLIDNLTTEEEDKLKEAHGKEYMGTDDDMPDAYDSWITDLSLDELKKHMA